METIKQNLVNHVAMVLDKSSSMSGLSRDLIRVFDSEIAYLKQRSIDLDQETRVSIYLFGDDVKCSVFDMDVMRVKSLSTIYKASGMTALIDGAITAISDMKKLPEIHGDHAFLLYVMTDGQENQSKYRSHDLQATLEKLPENWTVACMVPDARGTHEAKKFGFPKESISIWSTTASGVESAGKELRSALSNYMTSRASGVRGTKSFFVDLSHVTPQAVAANLQEIAPLSYHFIGVPFKADGCQISDFIKLETGKPYRLGTCHYELSKPEDIQARKKIYVMNKLSRKVYGGASARALLGLPDSEVRVKPAEFGDWRIFVQSTSTNRKLVAGTDVLLVG